MPRTPTGPPDTLDREPDDLPMILAQLWARAGGRCEHCKLMATVRGRHVPDAESSVFYPSGWPSLPLDVVELPVIEIMLSVVRLHDPRAGAVNAGGVPLGNLALLCQLCRRPIEGRRRGARAAVQRLVRRGQMELPLNE
jgi:hypothetical protein